MVQNTRWKKRIQVLNFIYSDVVSSHTTDMNNVIKQVFEVNNFDHDQIKILEYYYDHYVELEQKIIKRLKPTWPYQRINTLTKAIILSSLSEYYAINTNLAIIIDQALKTCDHRGLIRDKKFINAVLDGIIKDEK